MAQISERTRGTDEEVREVERAVRRFYEGIEEMARGEGAEKIRAAWHHSDKVSVRHPVDEWSVGWEEVWETWKFGASMGARDLGGSKVLNLRCFVYGEFAYAMVSFQMSPAFGGAVVMCTTILSKQDEEWKIVHHHADPNPGMQGALERMIRGEEGRSPDSPGTHPGHGVQ